MVKKIELTQLKLLTNIQEENQKNIRKKSKKEDIFVREQPLLVKGRINSTKVFDKFPFPRLPHISREGGIQLPDISRNTRLLEHGSLVKNSAKILSLRTTG